ncbi:MAG: hypothetical protein K2X27_05425 [Candidatus Obscuribacterales bacterium]|nr:hypothetical protein [Candidatus Obscuribacterales bacterium]
MRRLPYIIQSSFLISLSLQGLSADAQESRNVKRKIAGLAPAAALPPSTVRPQLKPGKISAEAKGKLLKSSYPSTALQRGYFYKKQGKRNQALIEFIQAAQENPRDVRAFYEQAQLFKEIGKPKYAKSALEQALAVAPGNSQARGLLVQLHFESGNLIGAAAEVGKLLNLNAGQKKTDSSSSSSSIVHVAAPLAAAQLASGTPSYEADATSVWLHSAANPIESKQNYDEMIAGLAKKSESKAAALENSAAVKEDAKAEAAVNSVAQVLNNIPGLSQTTAAETQERNSSQIQIAAASPATIAVSAANNNPQPEAQSAEGSNKQTTAPSKSGPSRFAKMQNNASAAVRVGSAAAGGLIAKMRSGTKVAVDNFGKPVPWVKEHLPLVKAKNEADSQASPANTEHASIRERGGAMLSWMKEKMPFGNEQDSSKKIAMPKSSPVPTAAQEDLSSKLASFVKDIREHLPFGEEQKTPALNDQHTNSLVKNLREHLPLSHPKKPDIISAAALAAGKAPGSSVVTVKNIAPQDLKKEASSPLSKMLESKFEGANITTSAAGKAAPPTPPSPADKEKEKLNEQLSQILASVPSLPEHKDSGRPQIAGPNYGLLKNNALNHLASVDPGELPAAGPGFFDGLIKQASKTFSGIVPSISWSKPNLPTLPSIKKSSKSPEAVVANVPAMNPEMVSKATPDPGPAAPVPLDVSRILNKIAAKPPANAPVLAAPPLSQSLPVAAAPSTINAMIPKPEALAAPGGKPTIVAAIAPRKLENNNNNEAVVPQSRPQSAPAQTPLTSTLPPMLQNVIDKMQPLIKPAMNVANNIVSNFAPPQNIPSSGATAPEPVASTNANPRPANTVPSPVSADALRHLKDAPIAVQMQYQVPEQPKQDNQPLHITEATFDKPESAAAPPRVVQAPPATPPVIEQAPPVAAQAPAVPAQAPAVQVQAPAVAVQAPAVSAQTPPVAGQATAATAKDLHKAEAAVTLPPVVQAALDSVAPVVQPAVDAASKIVQPAVEAASKFVQTFIPEPATTTPAPSPPVVATLPQAPVAAPAAGPSGVKKLLDMEKSKSGAFSYMKPVIDSDKAFIQGEKQIRTIQPLPGKPQTPKPAVQEDPITKRMRYLMEHGTGNLRRGEAFMFSEETGEGILFMPDGSSERRILQAPQSAEKVMRERRPDIIGPKDLQYSLNLLGKLLPPQNQQNNYQGNNQNVLPVSSPTLDQLMSQMNQSSKGFFGWMKKSLKMQ